MDGPALRTYSPQSHLLASPIAACAVPDVIFGIRTRPPQDRDTAFDAWADRSPRKPDSTMHRLRALPLSAAPSVVIEANQVLDHEGRAMLHLVVDETDVLSHDSKHGEHDAEHQQHDADQCPVTRKRYAV